MFMNDVKYDKEQTRKYLIWTFVIAWIMQAVVVVLYRNGLAGIGQMVLAASMFVPLLGVLLSGHKLSEMGWKPCIRGNVIPLLMAWFFPAILTAIGAGLYFMVFPSHFDISGEYLAAVGGAEALKQLEAQGLSYSLYILISVVSCLTYAPLINMFFGVGEEVGWRGFLYPQLKSKYGKQKGLILGGIIWGIWHWPLIWLMGYEYGTDYVGFPITGMLLFCAITVTLGILCDWLYERSKCIWFPAIFHGALNGAGTIPLAVCLPNTGSMRLLGPAPVGILSAVPFIILAGVLLLKSNQNKNII